MNTEDYEPKAGIYALCTPETGRVMYIGQSIDIDRRFREHLGNYEENNLEKRQWLGELKARGEKPLLKVLVTLSPYDYHALNSEEARLIHEHRARGEAELNKTGGGANRSVNRLARTSKDDWITFAKTLYHLRESILTAADQAGQLAGAEGMDQLLRLNHKLDKMRYVFQRKIDRVFPEWVDFSNFYFNNGGR